MFVNMTATLVKGIPVYFTFTFKDWYTLLYSIVVIVTVTVHHYLMVCIYNKYKRKIIHEMI